MSNKFCIHCKYCKKDARQSNVETCYHPKIGYNLVTGEPKSKLCETLREGFDSDKTDGSTCGKLGLWFELKSENISQEDNFHILSYQRGVLDSVALLQQIAVKDPYLHISEICKRIESLSIHIPWKR